MFYFPLDVYYAGPGTEPCAHLYIL